MRLPLDTISRIATGLASRWRVALFRSAGMHIGPRCRLENIRIRYPNTISLGSGNAITAGCWLFPSFPKENQICIHIGNNNFFNRDCMVDACGEIVIGNHNMFGPGVYITDSNHVMDPPRWITETAMEKGTVVIGNGCWIGTRAIILKNVHLGDNCIVAAGAVVTTSFPSGSVVAGVPARLIR